MAYASLVSLAQVLEEILCPDQQHHNVVDHEKEQIKTLGENIIFLTTFFEDFAGEVRDLEARITTAANQAEDIIECHISDELSEYGLDELFSVYGSEELRPEHGSDELRFGLKHHNWQSLCRKLPKTIEEIDSILKEVIQIKSSRAEEWRLNYSSGSTSNSSRLLPEGKDAMVGFEEQLIELRARLRGEQSQLHIIPIVGMGGIGKTTLAKYAHDDLSIVDHFDFLTWVTVSQNYDARRILLDLLYSDDASNKGIYEELSEKSLRVKVRRYLRGRRYLIVMDDMWDTNVWDDVQRILPDDANGSRVIITTRDLHMASYADSSSHPYQMQLMDVEQSWRLLKQKVFRHEDCPPELEEVGKSIAKNCRGLPLAIVVIAGVLSNVVQMQDTWKDIARDVNKAVNTGDKQFLEILSLSCTHLPHHLRPCFLYMGAFPEDHEIKVSQLIRLWRAEGFLKSNGSRDLEEMAEEYLVELVKRSLILVIKKRSDGKIKAVKIHDLLRDLCLNKARDDNFIHVINEFSSSSGESFQNSRRFSISSETCVFPTINFSPIHSILLFHHTAIHSWKSFRLLRVMGAMCVEQKTEPVEISELFHLRYLAISLSVTRGWRIEINKLLSNLQNLQTLILYNFFSPLPIEIWGMRQLRHLMMWGGLPEPCDGMLALENLHTLVGVTNFICSRRICEMMPNLKKLELIYNFQPIYEGGLWDYYCLQNLVYLHKLEKLKIDCKTLRYWGSLSQNVAFPRTLKKLTLFGFGGFDWKDMHIIGSLPNLEVLKLLNHACEGFKWETTEGGFCQLKVLLIDTMVLEDWITKSDHFPRLERLVLYDCHRLREIPQCIGDIPTLQLIEVGPRSSSIVESAKRIGEEQQSYRNDLLQVHLLRSRHWKLRQNYW